MSGDKVEPDDPRYPALLARGFNKRFAGNPDYVRLVVSAEQVVDAVQEAVSEGCGWRCAAARLGLDGRVA